jgi:FkbM family methyltransferase
VNGGDTTESSPVSDREERSAYFDLADQYTPYLATVAEGALFLVKTEDKHIGRSLFAKQGRGELLVLGRAVAAIEGLFGPDALANRTFVDVGANIGTTTIPAVLSHGFDSAVAIEPEPENVRVLRLNVLINDLEDRVNVLAVAVSNEAGRSDLVVNRERGGKHWIATDPSKLKRKSTAPDSTILTVETVTLDHLVETGVIEAKDTGLLWMDAEAHEGHILEGASSLLARGTPLVLEWNPVILDRMGDRGKLERAVAENYTHFAGMHRNPNPLQPSFALQTVDRLPAYAERFLDPSNRLSKTDILVLRLEQDQAAGVRSLDAFVARSQAYGAEPDLSEDSDLVQERRHPRALLSRLRSRLTRRRLRP